MSAATQFLGPEGPLAARHPSYESRAGQLNMTSAVEQALREEQILFCEAGTGIGKTFAYLVPALQSGKKVVISTATKALQDQILTKDVPQLEEVWGRPLSVVALKGLSNYLCLRRWRELQNNPMGLDERDVRKLPVVENWRHETNSGDLNTLSALEEQAPLRGLISSSTETRLGQRCPHIDECFVARARREAEAAQIVVVNHHLFFADLALRGPHAGKVLPEYDAVIFDEAHQLENVATLFFGRRISRHQVRVLLAESERFAADDPSSLRLSSCLQTAESANTQLFEGLASLGGSREGRTRLSPDAWQGPLYESYLDWDAALEGIEQLVRTVGSLDESSPETTERRENLERRARALRDGLAEMVEGAPGSITWMDKGSAPALSCSPVDLAPVLKERLFEQVPAIILTSATLATHEGSKAGFEFVRKRLGAVGCIAEVIELVIGSPFNFTDQSLLYLPRHLPSPQHPDYLSAAVAESRSLIQAAKGGALVLTTSIRTMHALAAGLRESLPELKIRVQGDAPRMALLAEFRQLADMVLVATMGFWEGVDIPGRALRLVIIDKIPFPVPTEPLLQARSQALEEAGLNPFRELSLPLAQMALKQGFGRLIRSEQDRGVVAILDNRLQTRGYGEALLAGLPGSRKTLALEDAIHFLQDLREA